MAECLFCSKRAPAHVLTRISADNAPREVWACDDHANKAVQRVSIAYGSAAVRLKLQHYIKKENITSTSRLKDPEDLTTDMS